MDFTEFLNYKGCTTSFHNPNRPAEKEKPKVGDVLEDVVENSSNGSKHREALIRPDLNTPMIQLKPEVTPSLKKALDQQLSKLTLVTEKGNGDDKKTVNIGDACQQRGCGKTFSGPER